MARLAPAATAACVFAVGVVGLLCAPALLLCALSPAVAANALTATSTGVAPSSYCRVNGTFQYGHCFETQPCYASDPDFGSSHDRPQCGSVELSNGYDLTVHCALACFSEMNRGGNFDTPQCKECALRGNMREWQVSGTAVCVPSFLADGERWYCKCVRAGLIRAGVVGWFGQHELQGQVLEAQTVLGPDCLNTCMTDATSITCVDCLSKVQRKTRKALT